MAQVTISKLLRVILVNSINKNNNVDYNIINIDTIKFTETMISIWMTDGNRFNINYDIVNNIEISNISR